MGAFDFVEKPLSLEKTVLVVGNAVRQRRLEAENRALRAHVDRRLAMVGESYVMQQLREQIAMAAPDQRTGADLRRERHRQGAGRAHRPRAQPAPGGPFVEVNCAAIPEELIESELFGHVKGAFTGAMADRRGKFELADGGTLFLDEIGDMSLKTQAKVLRALQEQVVEPVGGASSVRVDVRVLAATNKDLTDRDPRGALSRGPLLRLNVIPIYVPPLRERPDDILLLAEHFLTELAASMGAGRRRSTPERVGGCAASAGRATCASCATSSSG